MLQHLPSVLWMKCTIDVTAAPQKSCKGCGVWLDLCVLQPWVCAHPSALTENSGVTARRTRALTRYHPAQLGGKNGI